MPLRPETFGYLPPLSHQQMEAQVSHAMAQGWLPHVEFAENPNSADFYWQNWPLRPARIEAGGKATLTASHVVGQIESCARRHPYAYVRFAAYSPQSRLTELAFICTTPEEGQSA
ncbi:MAG: ribulose bisphosphate carboxylase small subunit [Pseudomonadaceae bacterium]|nr:ribulose bisphosphate carboxylase small subunit [Pseudomonadaceae bacterium]